MSSFVFWVFSVSSVNLVETPGILSSNCIHLKRSSTEPFSTSSSAICSFPSISTSISGEKYFTDNATKAKVTIKVIKNNEIEKLEEVQEVKPLITTPVPSINKISKVYVGQFSNIEQAIAMQNKLTDAGLDLAPFVKRIDNYYVVQIGSYASKEKAQAVVLQVQGAGFPAQLVNE